MKGLYSKYTENYSWIIKEDGWVRDLQAVRETQMALGNGFAGARAVLEELPYDSRAGTYIAGLYDNTGAQVSELVNLPNPFNFKLTLDGEKLGVVTMDVIEHKRALNMRNGLLVRHTVFRDTRGRRYDYESLRFLSMENKNIGVMQIAFTPLDSAITASVQTGIDTSIYNAGTVTEGRKKHFRVKELGQFKNEGYLLIETFNKAFTVITRSGFYYKTKGKKKTAKDNIFNIKLNRGQRITFTKIFYMDYHPGRNNIEKFKKDTETGFRRIFQKSFNYILKRHITSWERLWDKSEAAIWGDPETEKNLRFNIYHMLICAPQDRGASSIGAKALTGEGYRGHIFWDTEIFMLPFYIYIMPSAAKNILLYRFLRLDAARQRARKYGFRGAMFPWESAGTGADETPDRAKDIDGKVIKIHTGEYEHHITADIAYGFYHYYNATGDENFFRENLCEIFFETARFWASRVKYNKKRGVYEIKNVIGPDEFHVNVNNNAFTNFTAKWNLFTAYRIFQRLKNQDKALLRRLSNKIKLQAKEPGMWKDIAARIYFKIGPDGLIEQFDRYFRKRDVKISRWDENYMPVIPQNINPRQFAKTQFVKQADVVMLLVLFSDVFSLKIKRKNYDYYTARTLHKSSLSPSMYALLAVEAGDTGRAYRFFTNALHADISNINGNTQDGIHAACIGGTWQVFACGFAGVRIIKGILSINPSLPARWRKILFSIQWKGALFKLELQNNRVKIRVSSVLKKNIKIRIFGRVHEMPCGVTKEFRKKRKEKYVHGCYL